MMVGMLGIPTHSKHVGKENREIQPNHHPKSPIIFFYGISDNGAYIFYVTTGLCGERKTKIGFFKEI